MNVQTFSSKSLALLNARKLNERDIEAYQAILAEAKDSDLSAKAFLKTLDAVELNTLQKANSLVDNIIVDGLSNEGAKNLLAQPDGSDLVDLNNDGIVEIGIGRSIHFPPVNAPEFVKKAWNEATAGLEPFEKATLELTMHHMIYGVNIEGVPKQQAPSPEQQWSAEGIEEFFSRLYGNLEFRVGFDGWTDYNLMLKGVYERFSELLGSNDSSFDVASDMSSTQVKDQHYTPPEDSIENTESGGGDTFLLDTLTQLLWDARLGIDREKLEALEKEKQDVLNDESLSGEERQAKLTAIQSEIENLLEKARQRMGEDEKRRQQISNVERFSEWLHEKEHGI
ncbi:hypothetical protein [Alteromonas facilis]|uniref:hypothetical protein n=1 Tax=Alteromonas facilis TaxID=2048004 RepID=UPI000C28E466|nr:hypothetical protein [Alteromonas facilis]